MPCGTPRGVTHGMKSWRLLLLVALLLGLFLLGRALGLTSLSAAQLRATLGGAGPAGALLFLGAFVLGELVHIPGLVFVAVAVQRRRQADRRARATTVELVIDGERVRRRLGDGLSARLRCLVP